jgi:NADPH-dependent ferric siderophore reductase
MNQIAKPHHQISRVRRDVRRRCITVASVEHITPSMRRVHFTAADLHDFESPAPDDHVKLFVPDTSPQATASVCMRDYTPRAFDAARGTLTIDFALHEAGPATAWALAARPGDSIETGGPRGSTLVADDFDWYLLIGDETALPAIGRWVESRRPNVPVKSVVTVKTAAERQEFATRAHWQSVWLTRTDNHTDGADIVAALTASGPLPEGDGYIWIAGEASMARTVRAHVIDTLGHNKSWVKASGYWQDGQPDSHVKID